MEELVGGIAPAMGDARAETVVGVRVGVVGVEGLEDGR